MGAIGNQTAKMIERFWERIVRERLIPAASIRDQLNPAQLPPAQSGAAGAITLAGDLAGPATGPTVVGLQTFALDGATPGTGDVLTWDGTKWTPQAGSGAGVQLPTVRQYLSAGTAATSIALNSAPTAGHSLILFTNSTTGQVTSVACTNVTWTQVKTYTSGGGSYYAIWVGVVGASAGTTITWSNPGAFASAAVIEIADTLTPTLGANATNNGAGMLKLSGVTANHIIVLGASPDNTLNIAYADLLIPAIGTNAGNVVALQVGYATGADIAATANLTGAAILAELT